MNKILTKSKDKEIIFSPIGTAWSMYVPESKILEVYISVDEGEHFVKFGNKAEITGPQVFNCTGFNQGSYFMIRGLENGEKINVLL